MKKYLFFYILFITVHNLNGQSTDALLCEKILSKESISKYEFELIDSLLFEMNYYVSDVPLNLYRKAIRKAKENGQTEYEIKFEIWIANLFDQIFNPDSSFQHANNAATLAQQIEDEVAYARTANIRRLGFARQNNYPKALAICYEALEIFERHEDEIGKAITYRDIGTIKIHERKYEEALDFCLKSIAGLENSDQLYELIFSYQRTTIAYCKVDDLDEALNIVQKGIETARRLNKFRKNQMLTKVYWTRSSIHRLLGDFENALIFLDSTMITSNSTGYKHISISILNEKGSIFLKQKKYEQALVTFTAGLDYIKKEKIRHNTYDNFIPIYSNLIKTYEGLGQYKKANEYLNKITLAKDSIFEIEKEKQKEELETKYETNQKEATIVLLEKDKLAQRSFLLLSAVLLLVLGILALFLFKNNRFRAKINKELEHKQTLIETKNAQNELLLKEIHHRVKNNLQTISSLLSLQSNSIDDPNALDAVQESRNRVTSIALIHQKLYQGENLAAIEMREYFETIGQAIISSFGNKVTGVELDIEMAELELDIDTAIPIGLIANELITNSLKYAFTNKTNGKISISMKKKEDNMIHLSIADNGIHVNEGTSEGGTGFGTMLINLLTTQIGGQLEQNIEEGTHTNIKFYLSKKAS